MSLKDKLAKAGKRATITIDGETVVVVEPSYAVAMAAAKDTDPANGQALVVIATLCDVDGNPVFTAADVEAVKALPISVMKAVDDALKTLRGDGEKKA